MGRHGTLIAFLAGVALAFCLYRLTATLDRFSDAVAWYGGAFAVFFLMAAFVRRFWGKTFISLELLLGWALVFRILMLFAPQLLSDDIYRYIWDGRVSQHGINPYRFAPDAENLVGLRDSTIYAHVNHPEIPTIYPPLSQLAFAAATWISESLLAMKIALMIFDAGVILVLLAMLRFTERALSWVIVWAWNPLVIVEITGQGHVDVIAIFFTIAAVYAAMRARAIWAAGLLGLAFVSKLSAWYLLPFLEDIRHRGKTVLWIIGCYALTVCLFYWPYSSASFHWFTAFQVYASSWEFNGFLYSGARWIFERLLEGDPDPGHWFGFETDNKARLAAKIVLGAGFIILYGILLVRFYRKSFENQREYVLRVAYLTTGGLLLISPTLHPWYLLWMIPFLCFYPNPGWLLFCALVNASYSILPVYRATGRWDEDSTILLIQYLPLFVTFLYFLTRWFLRRRGAHPSPKAD